MLGVFPKAFCPIRLSLTSSLKVFWKCVCGLVGHINIYDKAFLIRWPLFPYFIDSPLNHLSSFGMPWLCNVAYQVTRNMNKIPVK